jgi:hypothetical protein
MISLVAGAIRGVFVVAVLPCQFLALFAQDASIEEAVVPVTSLAPDAQSAKGDERISESSPIIKLCPIRTLLLDA